MATLILSTVGTAIGGPIGSAVGAFVGQQIDGAIFGGGSREGPRLKELSVTTSSYGQPIPRNFGRMRVAGSIVWSTDLVESSQKEGGGKGRPSTKTYSYSVSFAVALSSTPIGRIGRIWADGNLLRGADGDLKIETEMRTYLGHGDDPVDPLINAERGGDAPAFRDCAYVVFENLQLAEYGNRIPALTFEIFAQDDQSVSISQLVPQAGNPADDIVLHNARGFADEGGPLGATLSAIDRVLPLDCIARTDSLRFASDRTHPNNVPTLPEQLSDPESENGPDQQSERGETLDREPLALRYYDEARDYQPGIQRALGHRPEGRETVLDLPAAMTAQGASELANYNAHRARWNDQKITWRIGELDTEIGPGSIVRVPKKSGYWKIRSWEWFDRGIELRLERFAPDLVAPPISDGGAANTPVDLATPPTLLAAFETPADGISPPGTPMLFAAASSAQVGWQGAALFVEEASTLRPIGSAQRQRSIIGTVAGAIEPSNSTVLEPAAELVIELPSVDFSFNNTDVTGLAMGENRLLVADEVIQFLNAAPIDPHRWKLTGLLRGRAGTEDAALRGHGPQASAVLLDDSLTMLSPGNVAAGQGVKLAAIGRGDSEAVYATLGNAGLSQRPLIPVAMRFTPTADGTWKFSWTRRARGHWQWRDTGDVPLVEEREAYFVGFGPVERPLAGWNLTSPVFEISAPDRDNLLTQFGPQILWVRQVGTFGSSSPLKLGTIS